MTINSEKYEQAVLFFIHECNNRHLGKTKLMKLLYFLDFDHYEQFGEPVTGDIYKKFPRGPVPCEAEQILSIMEREGQLQVTEARLYDFKQTRYTPLQPFDLSVFTEQERMTLFNVASVWRDVSRHDIVEATHNEEPWMAVADNEEIPLAYAYYRDKFPVGELRTTT